MEKVVTESGGGLGVCSTVCEVLMFQAQRSSKQLLIDTLNCAERSRVSDSTTQGLDLTWDRGTEGLYVKARPSTCSHYSPSSPVPFIPHLCLYRGNC